MSRMLLQTKAATTKTLIQKRQSLLAHPQTKRRQPGSHSTSLNNTLQLNQAIGNRATMRHLDQSASVRVQPKLAVGHFDDPYEQQANQVAAGQKPVNFRQATQANGMPVSDGFARQLGRAKSGQALPEKTQAQMEARFGTDLSRVRVHTDSQAGQLNQQLQSQAFTHGHDIYFNQGDYQPESAAGDQLLTHELTHVAQQQGNAPALLQTGGRTGEEVAKQITELCKKNGKPKLIPNLLEVVNLCLATFKDNTEIEDEIFDYLPIVLPMIVMPENASKQLILNELSSNVSDLTEVKLPSTEEDTDDSLPTSEDESDLSLDTILPIELRPVIKLYMEQGVAAPLGQVVLFSGQFSTCSPVVMLNSSTGVGGLFHFGANSLHDQADSLLALCDEVKPEVIYLMHGATPSLKDDDQVTLSKFFKEKRPSVEIVLDDSYGGLYITLGSKGQPKLYPTSPKDKSITHDLRKAHKVKLPPNTHFFGKSEVADFWI